MKTAQYQLSTFLSIIWQFSWAVQHSIMLSTIGSPLVCRRLEVTLLVSVVTSLWFTLYKQQLITVSWFKSRVMTGTPISSHKKRQTLKCCNESLMSGFITSKQVLNEAMLHTKLYQGILKIQRFSKGCVHVYNNRILSTSSVEKKHRDCKTYQRTCEKT